MTFYLLCARVLIRILTYFKMREKYFYSPHWTNGIFKKMPLELFVFLTDFRKQIQLSIKVCGQLNIYQYQKTMYEVYNVKPNTSLFNKDNSLVFIQLSTNISTTKNIIYWKSNLAKISQTSLYSITRFSSLFYFRSLQTFRTPFKNQK